MRPPTRSRRSRHGASVARPAIAGSLAEAKIFGRRYAIVTTTTLLALRRCRSDASRSTNMRQKRERRPWSWRAGIVALSRVGLFVRRWRHTLAISWRAPDQAVGLKKTLTAIFGTSRRI